MDPREMVKISSKMTFTVSRHRASGLALLLALVTLGAAVPAKDAAKSADDVYLDQLSGPWNMQGMLGSKPVRYIVDSQRVLHGSFIQLHMMDVAIPTPYEADVFIGFDAKAHDYIAHWLDLFGAAGARVVARGERRGQQLVLIFPYPDGAFRDTFTWQPESKSWLLLLESQTADGKWCTFANYTLTRRMP
jgi:hypothetical protein